MESLLIKTLNSQDKSEELKFMEKLYNDDVNISVLTAQMEILQVLMKDGDYFCFDDIIVKVNIFRVISAHIDFLSYLPSKLLKGKYPDLT